MSESARFPVRNEAGTITCALLGCVAKLPCKSRPVKASNTACGERPNVRGRKSRSVHTPLVGEGMGSMKQLKGCCRRVVALTPDAVEGPNEWSTRARARIGVKNSISDL